METKTNEYKRYGLIALIGLLIAAVFYIDGLQKQAKGFLNALQVSQVETAKANEVLYQERDEKGRLQTIAKTFELGKAEAELMNYELADSLKALGIKLKNVQSALRIRNQTAGVVKAGVTKVAPRSPAAVLPDLPAADTAKAYRYVNYKDVWLALTARVPLTEGDLATIAYRYKDDYIITYEQYRPKWYKGKVLAVRVVPQNPNTDSSSIQTLVIRQTKYFYQTTGFKMLGGAATLLLVQKGAKNL